MLQTWVDSNSEQAISDACYGALSHLSASIPCLTASDISNAMDALCTLKGVGPATATAVLQAMRGSQGHQDIPYFADPVARVVMAGHERYGKGIQYTKGYYVEMRQRVLEVCKVLNGMEREDGDGKRVWTAVKVEQAIWVSEVLFQKDSEKSVAGVVSEMLSRRDMGSVVEGSDPVRSSHVRKKRKTR